jgi:predicted RNA-binding Zn-ribbon protein involved in translation (DUF1610 family)
MPFREATIMAVERTCNSCGQRSSFEETGTKGSTVECPRCGSSIRIGKAGEVDKLSETMRIDLREE